MARKTLISTLYAGAFTKRGVKLYGGIALLAIIIIAIVYFNTQMRPVDLLSKFESDQPPVQGQIVRYDFDQNKTVLELEGEEMVQPLWDSVQNSQVRYMQHFSSAAVPLGGYYYEITLVSQEDLDQGIHTYAFACNTSGETVIHSQTFKLTGKSTLFDTLDALFTQYEDQVTLAS